MNSNYKKPPSNTIILVYKWCREKTEDGGYDYYRDYDEINSNDYNPACYDGWDYVDNNNLYEVDHKDYDLRYHKNYNFLYGSLDGSLVDKITNQQGVLEIKTCNINQHNYLNWKDKIPNNYYCQVLHYLLCTSFDFAIVYALLKHTNNLEIKKYEIKAGNVKDEIEYLLSKEIEFWNEYVLKDKEPPLILPGI